MDCCLRSRGIARASSSPGRTWSAATRRWPRPSTLRSGARRAVVRQSRRAALNRAIKPSRVRGDADRRNGAAVTLPRSTSNPRKSGRVRLVGAMEVEHCLGVLLRLGFVASHEIERLLDDALRFVLRELRMTLDERQGGL